MPRTALNFELPANAPQRVELIPAGPDVVGRDGRQWVFDADAQDQILSAFAQRGLPLPIDINHSSETAAPNGGESPAAAWIERLEVVDGALWGVVDWTPRGREAVTNREYRFLSPVFEYHGESKRITRLISAGLVNNPNLKLQALNREESPMSRSTALVAAIAFALMLDSDATDDQVATAINALRSDRDTLKATNAQQPSLDRYVPRADYDAVALRATNAEQKLKDNDTAAHTKAVDAEITAALTAGKITPATEGYHRASCADQAGLERFRAFVSAAPVIGADTDLGSKKPTGTDTALNAEERAVLAATGVSEADFLAARKAA
jgi:phage I-like protein